MERRWTRWLILLIGIAPPAVWGQDVNLESLNLKVESMPEGPASDVGRTEAQLLAWDRHLAQQSARQGLGSVWSQVLAEDAVVLPTDGHPLIGMSAFRRACSGLPAGDLNRAARWEPLAACVSSSGDLGYTYGRCPGSVADSGAAQDYYASVWRRSGTGDWQLAFSRGQLSTRISGGQAPDLQLGKLGSDAESSLVETERAFARTCIAHGISRAFCEFMDTTGIALTGAGAPVGRAAFCDRAAQEAPGPPQSRLEWEPIFTHTSAAADMGYNFGPYTFRYTDTEGRMQCARGYFMTIWRRQPDGGWRFVLDGGNQCSIPGAEG